MEKEKGAKNLFEVMDKNFSNLSEEMDIQLLRNSTHFNKDKSRDTHNKQWKTEGQNGQLYDNRILSTSLSVSQTKQVEDQ